MHIVLANQWYPPESGWGGVSVYNSTIAHAYAGLGHRVTVIAARFSQDVPAERCEDGLRVRRLLVGDAYRLRRLPILGRYVRPAQQLAYSWRVNQAIGRLHQECPVDIVEFAEVNYVPRPGNVAWVARKLEPSRARQVFPHRRAVQPRRRNDRGAG